MTSIHLEMGGSTVLVGTVHDAGHIGLAIEYDASYLARTDSYPISPDAPLQSGVIAPTVTTQIGALADAQPDSWGRRVIGEALFAAAQRQRRPLPQLRDIDYLLAVDDETRQGALRISDDDGATFLATRNTVTPGIVELDRLTIAAQNFAENRATDEDLRLLFEVGSSPGGAQPKVSVLNTAGHLAIAKIPTLWEPLGPSWEYVALEVAAQCGINTPRHELVGVADGTHLHVVERFDREANGGRRGYISARTLLMQGEHEDANYEMLASRVRHNSPSPDVDSEELYRRIALTLYLNNIDDHTRNHGFLRERTGWRLAPVFDVNPTARSRSTSGMGLRRRGQQHGRGLRELLDMAGVFGLSRDRALQLIGQVDDGWRGWRVEARSAGLDLEAVEYMTRAFEGPEHEEFLTLIT